MTVSKLQIGHSQVRVFMGSAPDNVNGQERTI